MDESRDSTPGGPRALDIRLVDSVAATAASKVVVQLVSWASIIVVARLLSPADFGLVGMTTVYLGLVGVLTEFGAGMAIVNLRQLTPLQARQVNTLSLLLGLGGFAASCALAVPIAHFFRAPELRYVLPVMSLTCILASLSTVPLAVMQRDLRFRLISGLDAAKALLQVVVTVAAASAGAGFWALVLGGLVGAATPAAVCLAWCPVGYARPSLTELRHVLSFSSAVLTSNVSWYAYSNADFVMAGRLLGKSALGAYSFAWTLATLPGEKMVQLLMRVMPAFFSAQEGDLAGNRRYLYIVTECVSMVTFPAAAAITALGADFLHLAFGHKWDAALAPLIMLSIYAAVNSVTIVLPQVLNALGLPRIPMRNGLLRLAVFPPAFYFSARWGPAGIAAAWLVLYPLVVLPLFRATLRALDMRWSHYCRALGPGVTAAAGICAVTAFRSYLIPSSDLATPRFVLGLAVGCAAVAIIYFLVYGSRVLAYVRLVAEWAKNRGLRPLQDPRVQPER